jgi:hypothetical protein
MYLFDIEYFRMLMALSHYAYRTSQGRRKQCEAAGAAILKGHLLLNHHFFWAAIFIKNLL